VVAKVPDETAVTIEEAMKQEESEPVVASSNKAKRSSSKNNV
jgi:hypothetical protein